MPTNSILEAQMGVLEVLDALDVQCTSTNTNTNTDVAQQVNGVAVPVAGMLRRQRYFRSRKALVKAYMLSAGGLRHRIHGAVSLVRPP